MDGNLRVTKLTAIVPVDSYRNCSESSDDVKLSTCHIKVCVICMLCLCIVKSSALTLLMLFVFYI